MARKLAPGEVVLQDEGPRPLRPDEEVLPITIEDPPPLSDGFTLTPQVSDGRRVLPVDTREPRQAELGQGVGTRVLQRLGGTDVEDPLSLERAAGVGVGATGGALLGSRFPPNPLAGAAVGGLIGSVGGAVAPEATRSVLGKAGIISPEQAQKGLEGQDLRKVVEGEALLELATGGTLQGARLVGRATSSAIARPGKEGRELATELSKQGIDITPFQAGPGGKGLINVLGRFPIIGAAARKKGGLAERQLANVLQEVPNRVGPILGETDLGVRIFNESRNLFKAFHDDIGRRYDEVFDLADQTGVLATPARSISEGQAALDKIATATPRTAQGEALSAGKTLDKVRGFIETEILPMGTAPQSLRQMDGLLSKLDQEIASFPVDERKVAARALAPIQAAIKNDVVENVTGEGAQQISQRLAALDGEFTTTMSTLFETSVAKRFQSVRRQGLKGGVRTSEAATRTPEDQLARIVINTKSPQALDELFRLVKPETRKAITARIVDDSIRGAVQVSEGTQKINAAVLKRNFGLDNPRGPTFKVMEKAFRVSGVSMKDMQNLVKAAELMERASVPDASAFIARRATLGGRSALIGGLTGGVLAGGGGFAAGGGAGALLGGVLFLGGSRLLTTVISDPTFAKPFFKSLDKEASIQVRRQGYVRATRLGLIALAQDEGSPPSEAIKRADVFLDEIKALADTAITNRFDTGVP